MAENETIVKVYFIGIGGIGMSALARYFQSRGKQVSGYDRTRTPLTKDLEDAGIPVHYEADLSAIPKDADLVVYTPAIPSDHMELRYYMENGYEVVKRSDVLQRITASSFNICVAGTHGKTTITTMIAHILRDSGYGCNAFLGGISANYGTNFWSSDRNVCVIEADEYDRSFLKLDPDIAIVSAMDPDHLDIYGTAEKLEEAFVDFTKKIKAGGCLIVKQGLKRERELTAEHRITYSLSGGQADVYAANINVKHGVYTYDVCHKDWSLDNVALHMGGLHNIENSVAAITVAKYLKIEDEKIKAAMASFKGVKRRFEYILKTDRHVLIDDYAHHPEELKALIKGVKSLFKEDVCTVIFQPHLYSRTRDLFKEFAASLDLADEVILLPVYPARELPIEGVTSELILREMKLDRKNILNKEALLEWTKNTHPKLLIMCGAGDIDALVAPVKNILASNNVT